jgi:hypothetical protein
MAAYHNGGCYYRGRPDPLLSPRVHSVGLTLDPLNTAYQMGLTFYLSF